MQRNQKELQKKRSFDGTTIKKSFYAKKREYFAFRISHWFRIELYEIKSTQMAN